MVNIWPFWDGEFTVTFWKGANRDLQGSRDQKGHGLNHLVDCLFWRGAKGFFLVRECNKSGGTYIFK